VKRATGRTSDEYADVADSLNELRSLPEDDPERACLRDSVVERCLPLAEHIARRFDGRGESLEDLQQVARLGLVNAVDRFDPERGTDFASFAVPTIMGEVRRHFRDSGWAVRVPRRMKELHSALGRATADLSQRLGRAPSPSELAEELGIGHEEVLEGLVAGNAYQTVSVDRSAPHTDDGLTLADTLGEYDAALDDVDNHEALRPLLDALPTRERTIVVLRFFGNRTQTQIAEQVGVSQMHVSRLLAKTLAHLREQLGDTF